MTTITQRLEFDAGHRLLGHEGKCKHVHGHRYVVLLTLRAKEDLDTLGRVVDFSCVKRVVGGWIDEKLDHGFMGQEGDPVLSALKYHGCKVYEMVKPPTAEALAHLLYDRAQVLLLAPHGVIPMRVVVQETPNCSAEYVP